jgi:hypothetical protein
MKGAMTAPSVLWRRLDRPGHEAARLSEKDSQWHLSGTAVFLHERQPCRLDYRVICDGEWRTVAARIAGWVGTRTIEIECSADSARRWQLNGAACPQVEGCLDVDLNFSPSTNLLPLRRSNLAVGHEIAVRAAWLRFPSFALEPLEQVYRRIDTAIYRYESAGGSFATELAVDATGFVTLYPGFWQAEV